MRSMKRAWAVAEVQTETTSQPPAVVAPALARVVDALFAVERDPNDRRSRIALALLDKAKATCCPACRARFSLSGYRSTKTPFSQRATLQCRGCLLTYLVEERHVA